jgi:ribosomal-protein-alanine acetyltransferase
LKLRTATSADIPAIVALERQSGSAAHWSDQNYHSIFTGGPRRLVLIMESNHDAVAFAVARILGAEWEIENIVVAARIRRQGIASQLICELTDRARAEGAEQILLEVRESNFAARALYEKSGFAQSGCRNRYYSDPEENAICYSKQIRSTAEEMS